MYVLHLVTDETPFNLRTVIFGEKVHIIHVPVITNLIFDVLPYYPSMVLYFLDFEMNI